MKEKLTDILEKKGLDFGKIDELEATSAARAYMCALHELASAILIGLGSRETVSISDSIAHGWERLGSETKSALLAAHDGDHEHVAALAWNIACIFSSSVSVTRDMLSRAGVSGEAPHGQTAARPQRSAVEKSTEDFLKSIDGGTIN